MSNYKILMIFSHIESLVHDSLILPDYHISCIDTDQTKEFGDEQDLDMAKPCERASDSG